MIDGFKVREWELKDLKDKIILVPIMGDDSYVLAAVFRSGGNNADVLPVSGDPSFSLGRQHADGDQCLPSIITTDSMVFVVENRCIAKDGMLFITIKKDGKDSEPQQVAFFDGKSEGPCRLGRYYMNKLMILDKLGLGNVPVFTLDNRNAYGGLGSHGKILAWDGMVARSVLERCLNFTRPYEINKGEADKVYKKSLDEVCRVIERGIKGSDVAKKARILANTHKKDLMDSLENAVENFSAVKVGNLERKPVILVTGEIYVRSFDVANQYLVKNIEKLGGIALVEPVTSYFDYVNEFKYTEKRSSVKSFRDLESLLKSAIELWVMRRDEHHLRNLSSELLGSYAYDPDAKELISRGSKYVDPSYKGEAIITLGASDYFSERVDGIINVYPFNCMPGLIVSSKTNELKSCKGDIPYLNLPYDGHPDPNRDEQLGVFMYRVKEKLSDKRGI